MLTGEEYLQTFLGLVFSAYIAEGLLGLGEIESTWFSVSISTDPNRVYVFIAILSLLALMYYSSVIKTPNRISSE